MVEGLDPNQTEATFKNAFRPTGEGAAETSDETLLMELGNGYTAEVPLDGDVSLHDQATGKTEATTGRDTGEGSSTVVIRGEDGSITVNKTITGNADNVTGVRIGKIG